MTTVDWIIVGIYFAGMIGLSIYLGRGQQSDEDYYVGGRNLKWWAVGISTMATQSSAISFLSIPAFVAIKEGGGLTWLQYELAVPLAMIAVMVLLIPFFRKLELVSVYEYLELRFGRGVRLLISAVFQISRGLGAAVGLYASAIVLAVVLEQELWMMILLMGVITIIYDTIGGMAAVVYSDVIQTVVLLIGIFICIFFAVSAAGGFAEVFASLPAERWVAYDSGTGLGDGAETPFWAFLIGGFFLYVSYYGTDQSQTQRELSTPTLEDTKYALLFNGFARFPLTALYLLTGICLGAALAHLPELAASVEESGKPDYLVPYFIMQELPIGVRAIIVSALLAAAMSSLDSSLNSLSAATLRDFIEPVVELESDRLLRMGKIVTVVWGVFIVGFAFAVHYLSQTTVIEAINQVGSAFYGPVLAAFIVGVLTRRVTSWGVIAGVFAGVGFNLTLWLWSALAGALNNFGFAIPDISIYWMWWNLTGFVIATVFALVVSLMTPPRPEAAKYTLLESGLLRAEIKWWPAYLALFCYFLLILGAILYVENLAEVFAR